MVNKRVFCIICCLCLTILFSSCNRTTNENKESSESNEVIKLNEFGYIPLESLPDDYTINEAVMDGVINVCNDGIDNVEKFIEFFNNINNEADSMIRILQYTTEGEPVYTDVIFHCENLENSYFELHEKNLSIESFDYITTDGKDIYLSNEIEYSRSSISMPICFTALTVDKNIWENAVPIIQNIIDKELQERTYNSTRVINVPIECEETNFHSSGLVIDTNDVEVTPYIPSE